MTDPRTYLWLLDPSLTVDKVRELVSELASSPDSPFRGVVVAPTHVGPAEAAGAEYIVSVAGFPTGRHHGLVKAAEARLAVQMGASEVWVSVDDALDSVDAYLPDLVAIREACPEPVQLGMFAPDPVAAPDSAADADNAQLAARAASLAGFNRIIVPAVELATPLNTDLCLVVLAPNPCDDATRESWLAAGAAAVATPPEL